MEKQILTDIKLLICVLTLLSAQIRSITSENVNVTLLADALQKGAVCLDGSPGGYAYTPGQGDGAKNWLVYLPGGGWCASTDSCKFQIREGKGSTKNFTEVFFGGMLVGDQTLNPDFYNWNRVQLIYCDGSSFTGDVEAVDPGSNFYRRGSRIFNGVMDELLAKGMKNANSVILAGNSAGGLATILHCDHFRSLVPHASRVKCVSDSGFFIHAKGIPGLKKREKVFAAVVDYHGVDCKSLPASCTSRMNSSLCFYPENVVGDMQTPLFLLNSAFDSYQLQNNVVVRNDTQGWFFCTHSKNITKDCTPAHIEIMREFRNAFLQTLKSIPDSSSRGLFINSCYIHDFLYRMINWNTEPRLGNKTIAKSIGDWYFDRSCVKEVDTQTDYPQDCSKADP